MLYYGNSYNLSMISSNTLVFNITSYREDIPKLNLLPPIDKRLYQDSCRDFDMYYAEWILQNDEPFYNFFTIIYNLYLGYDVYLVINDNGDWSENIIESIMKLIQQRYGYNGIYIDSFESYVYAQTSMTSGFDSTYGLYNLDIDKDRYSVLAVRMNPSLLNPKEDEQYD